MWYESDAAAYVDEPEGYPRVTGEEGTRLSFVVLATADLRSWDGKPGGAVSRHGTVFHGGSIEGISNLDPATGDPILRQVTKNVFQRLGTRVVWNWEDIGQAYFGTALTAVDNKLFIAPTENLLWRRYPVAADVVWTQIGGANDVIAMAATGGTSFCVTADNTLWWRPPVEANVNWTLVGQGPAAGTRALAGIAGMLYAVDFIGESIGWVQIHHCNFSVGLAVIDKMLFVATTENRLWQLDLHGLRMP